VTDRPAPPAPNLLRTLTLLFSVAVLSACGPNDPPAPAGVSGSVRVLRVVDGDTVHVLLGGRDVTIRLIGVDAPEVGWYGGQAECFGARAGRFVMDLLEDERVRLEGDQERLDPYGRTLAYVYLGDGRMVNLLLVREGFATVTIFPPNDRHEVRLRAAEAAARTGGSGLWSACP
jgi:micrococcal nuclease